MLESPRPDLEGAELFAEVERLRRRVHALEGSEERYRVLFAESPVALWELDGSRLEERLEELRAGGVGDFRSYFSQRPEQALAMVGLIRVVEVNRATLALYGARSMVRLKGEIKRIFSEASFPAVIRILEALARGETRVQVEAVNGTLLGEEIEVEVKLVVSPGYESAPSCLLLAVTDITQSKRTARAMDEVKTTLERRVVERTAALATTHEDLKSLLSIVSHDLRAPLINVKGFSGELRAASGELRARMEPYLGQLGPEDRESVRRIVSEELPEAIDFIDSSVNRINQFMETLLQLSHEGKRKLHMERIDVEPLVREILDNLAFQIEQRQATVSLGQLPTVVADRVSLEQILGNVLSNAVLYLDSSRPGRIELQGQRSREEVTFTVTDNGRGISRSELPKVFAPFRRGGHQDVEGEGMGLAYVQALVRRHGGRIWCSSHENVGSTFHFTLSSRLRVDDDRTTQEIMQP